MSQAVTESTNVVGQRKLEIQRALPRLKILESHIQKAIAGGRFIGLVKGTSQQPVDVSFKNLGDLERSIQSSQDQVLGLIAEYEQLKAGVIRTNLATAVTFMGEQTTIADLINKKKVVEFKKHHLNALKQQLNVATRAANELTNKIDQQIQANTGGHATIDAASQKVIRDGAEAQNKPGIVSFVKASDNTSINDYIIALELEISTFEAEIDQTLSVVNATTYVIY